MEKDFFVLGIGASLGGLQSLSEFFETLDATLPFAIVLVTHLQADSRSKLDDILHNKTNMQVQRIDQDTPIRKGVVYVLVEELLVTVENGMLCVRPAEGKTGQAIDIFFESLADNYKERAIGIILSGTGKDGLAGSQKISEAGGQILVQEPFSALYQSLPRLIIKDDHPDKVLPAARLASWLNKNYSVIKVNGDNQNQG